MVLDEGSYRKVSAPRGTRRVGWGDALDRVCRRWSTEGLDAAEVYITGEPDTAAVRDKWRRRVERTLARIGSDVDTGVRFDMRGDALVLTLIRRDLTNQTTGVQL